MPQEVGTCFVCRGVVYPTDSITCTCGKKFHEVCAKAVSICPACGEEFNFRKMKIRVHEVVKDKKENEDRPKIKITPKPEKDSIEREEKKDKKSVIDRKEDLSKSLVSESKKTVSIKINNEKERMDAESIRGKNDEKKLKTENVQSEERKEDLSKLTPEKCKVMIFRFMCLGVDVSWAEHQLELVKEALKNGNEIAAENMMREIKDTLEFEINKNINDRIAKCRKFADMMEHMIEGIDDILKELQASKDSLFENKFEEALRHVEKAESMLAPVKRKFENDFVEGCRRLVDSVQFADTDKKIKEISENAIEALNSGQYYEALQFRDWLAREVAKTWPKISSVTMQKAKRKCEDMTKIGIDISKAKDILKLADDALSSGEHKKAVEYCVEFEKKIDEIATAELDKLFTKIEKKLFEIESKGEDISWAGSILAYARTAQQMGEYSNAFAFIEKIKKKIDL
ncbi:MAG: hypothetical protein QXT63_06750 [Thermoplasmata archaeon]